MPERPTVRVYFEPRIKAEGYAAVLSQLQRAGAVMGELLDSSDEKSFSTEAFQSHVEEYLTALPGSVDIWEVASEANGTWTGPYETVAAKLNEAYRDVADGLDYVLLSYYPTQCGRRMPSSQEVAAQLEELHASTQMRSSASARWVSPPRL